MLADSLNGVQVTWESWVNCAIYTCWRATICATSQYAYLLLSAFKRKEKQLSFNESKILKKNMFISVEPRHFILNLQNEVD